MQPEIYDEIDDELTIALDDTLEFWRERCGDVETGIAVGFAGGVGFCCELVQKRGPPIMLELTKMITEFLKDYTDGP